jgi:hypothetical protein
MDGWLDGRLIDGWLGGCKSSFVDSLLNYKMEKKLLPTRSQFFRQINVITFVCS